MYVHTYFLTSSTYLLRDTCLAYVTHIAHLLCDQPHVYVRTHSLPYVRNVSVTRHVCHMWNMTHTDLVTKHMYVGTHLTVTHSMYLSQDTFGDMKILKREIILCVTKNTHIYVHTHLRTVCIYHKTPSPWSSVKSSMSGVVAFMCVCVCVWVLCVCFHIVHIIHMYTCRHIHICVHIEYQIMRCTGWRRPIESLKWQVIFRNRTLIIGLSDLCLVALLWKMICNS